MAYVAKAPQGRRQDEGDAGGGQDYSSPTGGVQGTAKQSSMAKTPLQEQVKQAQGRSQGAAVDRIYKPVQSGFERAAGELARGAQSYEQNAAKETQDLYGMGKDAVAQQLTSRTLSDPLSQAVAGQKKDVGQLDLKVPMFQAATEIMKGGTAPGLLRNTTGKYSQGMANLDSQLLKKSGALGQLVPKVQQGSRDVRGLATTLNRDATAGAQQQREQGFQGLRGTVAQVAGEQLKSLADRGEARSKAETERLNPQRQATTSKAQSLIQQALAEAEKDIPTWGNQPEFDALRGIDINKYIQDVMGPQGLATLNPEEVAQYNYLAGISPKVGGDSYGTITGGYDSFDKDVGFDEAGLLRDIQAQMGGWQGRRDAQIAKNAAQPPKLEGGDGGRPAPEQLQQPKSIADRLAEANRQALGETAALDAARQRELQAGYGVGQESWDERTGQLAVDGDDIGEVEDRTPYDGSLDDFIVDDGPGSGPMWVPPAGNEDLGKPKGRGIFSGLGSYFGGGR